MSEFDQVAFYDGLAHRYDEMLTRAPIDRWTRRAFQTLVAETIPVGRLLLDFGCGTGLDALWYAQRGYRVVAYDVSSRMLDQRRRRCAPEIAKGQIIPVGVPFAEFPAAIGRGQSPEAVVSNYGVLNALEHPRAFFDGLAPVLAPGAAVVISALNPFFWKDMTQRWWWRDLARSLPGTAIVTRAEGLDTYRHFIASLVAAARPAFRLRGQASVGALVPQRGRPLDWDAPRTLAERLEARFWKSFPLRSCGMFVFLTFRRA